MDTSKNQAAIGDYNPTAVKQYVTPSRRGQMLRDRVISREPKKAPTNYTPPRKQRKKRA